MKKILLIAITITSLLSCETKSENHNYPDKATGYSLDSSANIEFSKKTLLNWDRGDLDAYKALYADTVIFYDNGTKQTLQQNIDILKAMHEKGITMKLDNFDAVFEKIDNIASSETGSNNLVFIYCTLTFSKGNKSLTIPFHQVNSLKGGIIIREWDFYNDAAIIELMK